MKTRKTGIRFSKGGVHWRYMIDFFCHKTLFLPEDHCCEKLLYAPRMLLFPSPAQLLAFFFLSA